MRAPKRNYLVRKAQGLFARQGFKGVSVDQILKEAGVARMTLYKGFGSKDALIQETLRRRDDELFSWFVSKVESESTDPEERLLVCFDAIEEWSDHPNFNGCYFVSALTEYGDNNAPENKLSRAHKIKMLEYVTHLCRVAGIENPGKAALDVRLLMEGATILKLTLGQTDSYQRAKQIMAILLKNNSFNKLARS